MSISITEFNKLLEKYDGKIPVHRMLFHFPSATIEDINNFIKYHHLKIKNGFIVSW